MTTPSERPHPLAKAYAATCYRLWWGEAAVDIWIGQRCPAMADKELNAPWTLLTAVNPGSQQLSSAINRRRLAALENELIAAGASYLPGESIDPTGQWPVEPGFWVRGVARPSLLDLAERHGQLAVVFVDAGQAAQLIWTATGRRTLESGR